MDKKLKLFVPGRLCLFGEHSDWASLHRVMNASIIPGHAIVTGVEQGIYATVTMSDKFIVESEIPSFKNESFECEMDSKKLRETAQEGGFFSYVAGVASYVNDHYRVKGLRIHVDEMNLPIKSGLSSSAAICVLVARAFNEMYNLQLNTMGEMNIAFYGEQRTPSRCGRLDQACAFGVMPVNMTFDGNEVFVDKIKVKRPLYWVFSELNGSKDTVKILSDLNKCYPFAETEIEKNVQRALGTENEKLIERAVKAIEAGDCESVGALMTEAQKMFDTLVAPASPKELASPELHRVLADEKIKEYTYGAKGVGSQGDGSVQFLAKDENSREQLIEYIKEKYNMEGFRLTLKPEKKVRKAIIPVAGFGTRLYPETRAIKKEFFPVIDRDGYVKPVIMNLLEQLEESGIEEVCLVIGEEEQAQYDAFFSPLSQEHISKLSEEKRAYEEKILEIGKKITYAYQKERKGFGHAVYQCREFAGNEPVLLLLGDMIYESFEERTCSLQLIEAYEECGKTMISMQDVPLESVSHYGIMCGKWENSNENLLKITQMVEKPDINYAKDCLKVRTKSDGDKYYCAYGQYILTPEVFEALEYNIKNNITIKGEIQLTDALDSVRETSGIMGFVFNGKVYDVGTPDMYRETIANYGR